MRALALCALLGFADHARAQENAPIEHVVDAIFAPDAELAPADAGAQRSAMARTLFEEGLSRARAASFLEAADLFQRAQALRPAPGIAYNLASALAQLGRLVEASELLEWVTRHPETPAGMRAAAHTTLGQLAPRIARVRLIVAGPTDDVVLMLDGAPLAYAAIGVVLPLDPGAHELEALRGEARIAHRAIELAEGAVDEIELALPPPERADRAPRVVPRPEPPPPSEDLTWLAWSGAALGVAIAIAVITSVVLLGGQVAEPVAGNTTPPFLEWE